MYVHGLSTFQYSLYGQGRSLVSGEDPLPSGCVLYSILPSYYLGVSGELVFIHSQLLFGS